MVLFGSRARDDAQRDSDIDVLVVLGGNVHPSREIERTGEIVSSLSLEYDTVFYVAQALHAGGLEAWLAAGRRSLSLLDCVSFALMHELHLDTAFTFDRHFAEQGFRVLPEA